MATALLLAACGGSDDDGRDRSLRPLYSYGDQGDTNESPGQHGRLQVKNRALGWSRRAAAQAIADLKRLGFWRRLTRGLYVINIGSRLSRHAQPQKNHLANAFASGVMDEGGSGAYCDIMFFPSVMKTSLEGWRRGTSAPAHVDVDDPAPTMRQLWASVLAHELVHCRATGNGEAAAGRMGIEVLDEARRRLRGT